MIRMIKIYLILICTLIGELTLTAQSSNFRAAGNYYSAKTNFKTRQYEEALSYILKSKAALGGTNEQLQYLHILTAYRLKKFEEAKKELELFFGIEENKVKPIYFDKSVDRLTEDETKELTILIDPVFEAVEKRKHSACQTCKGTGYTKRVSTRKCTACGDEDKGYYAIDLKWNDGYRKGFVYYDYLFTEKEGRTKSVCTTCNGKGIEKCPKCGNSPDVCKPCKERFHPRLIFYCEACSGSGLIFKKCTLCDGTKLITSTTDEVVTCGDCDGNGF